MSDALNTPTIPSKQTIATRLSVVGIGGNILLAVFKLVAGLLGHSTAMISDAVHSFSDVFATAIAACGVYIAQRAADAKHPFGHERFECLASLTLSLILALTACGIAASSINSITTGAYLHATAPSAIALSAAVVSIVVKESMFWYTRHWARVLNSSAFMADAWHHRSDALSSVGALIGIGGAMLGVAICDPLASIVICFIILKAAWDITRDAIDKLVDTPCTAKEEQEIRACIQAVAGVVRIDQFRTRQFGSRLYVEAEIAVDGTLSLSDAHAIAEAAHANVEAQFPDVKHIMIHENPA